MTSIPVSIADVAHVEVIRGAQATDAPPSLLIEVPHGADERHHYDTLRARLRGPLPDGLHAFFHVNTDVGAWDVGVRTAQLVVQRDPTRAVLLIRCLIPRTFIDTNRPSDFGGGDLGKGGMTAGIPAYVRDDDDKQLLLELHAAYVALVRDAFVAVCGSGGHAMIPHTYGPRSMGIPRVDDDIVEQLKWACAPERESTWPLRAELDLLTRDGDGRDWSPPGLEATLTQAFVDAGLAPRSNDTYHLHPATLGHTWSTTYPGRVLCFEIRRDLLVPTWTPFDEMKATPAQVERFAQVLAAHWPPRP